MAPTRRKALVADILLPALTVPQRALLDATERCLDAEGAIRSGKTTAVLLKLWRFALEHPGIKILAARWKAEDADVHLRGEAWRAVAGYFPDHLQPTWDGTEQAYYFPTTQSWIYVRGLKAGEGQARYSKFRGLTLAVVWVDQTEEIPQDVYVELKGRLSQKGYPKQIILTPNSVDEDDWIATEFPADVDRPGHRYLRFDLWSNAGNLDADTIAGFEQDYPDGHPKRRTMLEGRRGPKGIGDPVYGGYFKETEIDTTVDLDPTLPLLEGWDFGHSYPAVVWAQYHAHADEFVVLGGVQGKDMFLEQFTPYVLEVRDLWFPLATEIHTYCDPNGDSPSSHGMKVTAAEYLRSQGIAAAGAPTGNDPVVRDRAIQTVAGHMFRDRFRINPRCVEFVRTPRGVERRESRLILEAIRTGYVWSDKKAAPQNAPNVRPPQKGTRYDHTMNCVEYIVVGAHVPARPTQEQIQREVSRYRERQKRLPELVQRKEWQRVRLAQRDDVRVDHFGQKRAEFHWANHSERRGSYFSSRRHGGDSFRPSRGGM